MPVSGAGGLDRVLSQPPRGWRVVNVVPDPQAPAPPERQQTEAHISTPPAEPSASLEQLLGRGAAVANGAGPAGPRPPHSMAIARMVAKNAQRRLREALADEALQRREIRGEGLDLLA